MIGVDEVGLELDGLVLLSVVDGLAVGVVVESFPEGVTTTVLINGMGEAAKEETGC